MDEFWESCSVEHMGHLAYLQDPFDYERTTYLPEVLEIMYATEHGKHYNQEDLPYICWLWYKASSCWPDVEYDEFLKAVRAEVARHSEDKLGELQEELFDAIHKTNMDLHTFTTFGHWGGKMVLNLFVKIAALSIALWFVFMWVEEEEED